MTTAGLVSIVLPVKNEIFLNKTVQDLLSKSRGDIEIFICLDDYWPEEIINDKRVNYLHFTGRKGMRGCINAGVAASHGEFIMKIDGHCMLDEGFDLKLKEQIEDNWIVIPRRYRLDAESWTISEPEKLPIDYEFLNWPKWKIKEPVIHGNKWNERTKERMDDPKYLIDENMSFQGSCWFMTRKHWDCLGGMSELGYETFVQEAQELGLKTWLGGGKVMTNKKTWYAHLHKGKKYGRGYFIDKREMVRGGQFSTDYWMNNRWDERVHDISWLIERFWPVPTWPEDRELWVL